MLAHAAHCHDGGKQDRQGQCHRDKSGAGIKKQLGNDVPFQAFSNQVINVFPYKLHQDNEQGNEEGDDKRPQVRL